MHILIIGAGAIGTWLGACLGRSGQYVTLVGRQSFVEALASDGLRVQLPDGRTWRTSNARAVSSMAAAGIAAGMFGPPYDAILLCTKAYALDAALGELDGVRAGLFLPPASAQSPTVVAVFQNGVGSEERVAAVFGVASVVSATTTSPVSVVEPGAIRVERGEGVICLAAMRSPARASANNEILHSDPRVPTLNAFQETLDQAMLHTIRYADYRALKWSKLLLNIVGNATGAILDLPADAIYSHPRLFAFEMCMLREAIAVVRALNVRLVNLPGFPAATLALAVTALPDRVLYRLLGRRLAQGRGSKRPSLYFDVAHRTGKSEVTWLNGAVVDEGLRLGIATPVNARLTQVLRALVGGAADAADWRGKIDRLLDARSS